VPPIRRGAPFAGRGHVSAGDRLAHAAAKHAIDDESESLHISQPRQAGYDSDMKTIQLDIPEPVYDEFEAFAEQTRREPSAVMREALELYRDERIRPARLKNGHSILDHEPVSLGQILKPWTSRAEMLEDFFDRD
jgi:hypothetical protein